MGIISTIGRKHIKVQALIWSITIALILGGITMVYPFALMIAGSSKSAVDVSENNIIPRFLIDDHVLYCKTIQGLFNEKSAALQSTYDLNNGDFKLLQMPEWNFFYHKTIGQLAKEYARKYNTPEAIIPDKFYNMSIAELEQYSLDQHIQAEKKARAALLKEAYQTDDKKSADSKKDVIPTVKNVPFKQEVIGDILKIPTDKNSFLAETITGLFKKLPDQTQTKLAGDWYDFIKEKNYPFYYYGLGFTETPMSRMSQGLNLRKFKNQLYEKYQGNLDELNQALGTEYIAWNNFYQRPAFYIMRREMPNSASKQCKLFWNFKTKQPLPMRYYFSPEGFYKTIYLRAQYTKYLKNYNKAHKTNYKSWDEITFPQHYPAGKEYTDLQRSDWEDYVRNLLNLLWVRVDKKELNNYHEFLKAKYANIAQLNKLYGTKYKSYDEIPLITRIKFTGTAMIDWASFISGWYDPVSKKTFKVPVESLYVTSVDFDFRDYLKKKYGTIDNFNKEMHSSYRSWQYIFPPQQEYHYEYIKLHKADLRWEFVKRNFIAVADYILLHGRGVFNTFIYCSLAILAALIVNPLAAYALSRFKPPSTYKLLMFLMLTMAFPPMVTQIPNFLLLREFGLLNTYAALILPALANGYSIFLLKGFFDSLPQELYESAQIDGASEVRLFLQITMSLSKPILAVIALQTFQFAYSNFMMALLLCQDQRMWTLMPWLYQLQMNSNPGIIFASLLIAAVPTFLVFVFCQNIIMRGIVVPVEK